MHTAVDMDDENRRPVTIQHIPASPGEMEAMIRRIVRDEIRKAFAEPPTEDEKLAGLVRDMFGWADGIRRKTAHR